MPASRNPRTRFVRHALAGIGVPGSYRILLMVQLLRQFSKEPVTADVHLEKIDRDRNGAASFDAVDIELLLPAPLPDGIGDEGYVLIVK